VTEAQLPDLVVGLIRVRDAEGRSADEGAEIVPHVAELTAIVHNRGDAQADETTTVLGTRRGDRPGTAGHLYPYRAAGRGD
jgi:hypothetical protein